ncbi:hypothetical protein [Streptomyces sp. NPDC006645]|uniref:hypothetical protein n=1 Tax=unclassified Streptomyces TaxID=2593676 RepID=UPI0033B39717
MCPTCKRAFALEPKENTLRLHDVRMRKLIDKLGNGEGLRYTPTQLWYAAARNRTPAGGTSFGCVAVALIVATGFISWLVIGINEFDPDVMLGTLGISGVFLALTLLLTFRGSRRAKWSGTVEVPMSLSTFRTSVIDRWTTVYSRPDGLKGDDHFRFPVLPDGGRPRLVVLCPDRDVLACLALNNAHTTHSLALAQSPDQLGSISTGATAAGGPGLVGIVLHDASPAGLAFAASARAALGGRVVVAGMLPRSVMDKPTALRLRKPLRGGDLDVIRASAPPLTTAEVDWLSRGWWSPIAAVPPAKLLTVVARAVDRAEGMADPDRGRAQQVGFLTWPTAS